VRTTVNLDDDVLLAVRERARREHRTVGAVLSELTRKALTWHVSDRPAEEFHGFRPLPARGQAVSNTVIDRLREDEPE